MKQGITKAMRPKMLSTMRTFSTNSSLSKEFWLPFTNNRAFTEAPKLIERAEGMYYYTHDKKKILDGTSGLW